MRVNGTSAWSDACTSATAPFSCTGDTAGVPDGLYDVRAIATDGAAFTTTSATATTRVDNTAPSSASLTNPATNLSGTVNLSATGADAGSGIASVQFQSAPAGTSTWTTFCTDTTSSYTCAWDTTTMTDAVYDLRVVVTDNAGNTLSSSARTSKRVDNDGPTLTFTNPGTLLRGTVALTATATDPAGVTSVTFQYKPSTSGSWTSCAADTSSPYSCSVNTTGLTSGQNYDFRATSVDTLGHSSTSATYTAKIDNTGPTGTGVQAVNGPGAATPGKIDAGDTVTFTYSEAMAPASIQSGWDGSAVAVTVRVTNSGSNDLLTVYNAGETARLNLTNSTGLQLKANRVSGTAKWAATMVMSGNSVIITLGSTTSTTATTATTTTPMVWTPSASATDLAGNACATTAVTESGTDVDF
jgi:hypothetical protein